HVPLGISTSTSYPYGLYLDVCDQFNTEGNHFNGSGNAGNEGAAGLVVRNAGETPNEFYRSDFNDLRVGSQAIGLNRDDLGFTGLTFRCNDYEDDYNDLDVRHNSWVWYLNAGMAEKQGIAGNWYPDNLFGNNSLILNLNVENLVNRIDYIHDGLTLSSNRYYPYEVTPFSQGKHYVFRQRIDHSSACTNRIGSYGISFENIEPILSNIKPLLIEMKDDESELTDGGNTAYFLSLIENATVANKDDAYNQLMAEAPYLSNAVLAEIAQKESPFTQEQIRNLLLANPHSSRNTYIMELLDNRADNYPQVYIDSVESKSEVYTHRDTILAELAELENEYNGYLSEYIAGKLADSTTTVEQLHGYLKHPTQPGYHYHLADMYFAQNKFSQFNQVKDSIVTLFNLDKHQQEHHNSYSQLHSVMQNWYATDSVLHNADTGRYNYLQGFSGNYDVMPTQFYAMMALNDDIVLEHDVYMPEIGNQPFVEPAGVGNDLEESKDGSALILYPNPANQHAILEWKDEFRQAQVMVYDELGRLVWEHNWNVSGILKMNTAAWETGLYQIKVVTQNGGTHVRQIIINR
ncbi:MAG: T9SS type A sorting domain-containing protein, partial [Bacteroidetes bacterium]|nr:T9SS type A sorting domain-containing protein [Bacteroidota bacterium]